MAQKIFNRYENKYLINRAQYEKLLANLSVKMKPDKYNKDGRMYKIYNIYYDTESNDLIRTSLEKPVYKEKIRLRAYSIVKDSDVVFVEIKKKFDGLVNKRRIAIPLSQAKQFLAGKKISSKDYIDSQVSQEIREILQREKLVPKTYISYERMALFERDNDDLRVSFDHSITSSQENIGLDRKVFGKQLLNDDQYLMEIKTRWNMPLWLTKLLADYKIQPVSFSKYGKSYLNNLKEAYV